MDSPVLTHKEAAEYLRVCTKELKRLVDNGEIAFINSGIGTKKPHRKYLKADLNEYLNSMRVKECRSTNERNPAFGTTHSQSNVIDFMDQLA